MSGVVPLLPHVLSQRAQDSLYVQGVTSLLTSIHVPARTDSAIPVCEQPGSTDIVRCSAHRIGLPFGRAHIETQADAGQGDAARETLRDSVSAH